MTAPGLLRGATVALTRSAARDKALSAALSDAGAEVLFVPLIDAAWPGDLGPLDDLIQVLRGEEWAWLVVSSATTVAALTRRAGETGAPLAKLRGKIAAVGNATAAALEAAGLGVDLVPTGGSGAKALLDVFASAESPSRAFSRVLLPQSDLAADTLADGLRSIGWRVTTATAYRTVDYPANVGTAISQHRSDEDASVTDAVEAAPDVVVLTSPSTAKRWFAAQESAGPGGLPGALPVTIGPTTAAAVRELQSVQAGADSDPIEAVSADPNDVVSAVVKAINESAAREQFAERENDPANPGESDANRR